jgi:NAD-dependent deacetylase
MIAEETILFIKEHLKKGKAVALTGAGISSESGIPTFRGKGGLWEKYDPEIFANMPGLLSTFVSEPEKLVDFTYEFYSTLLKAGPNLAHTALSTMEESGHLSVVITQNIDNLHQQAGSRSVIELHGNAYCIRCIHCAKRIYFERDRIQEMITLLAENKKSRNALLKVLSRYFPRCDCGGRFRIDIVLFGEILPEQALQEAYAKLEDCSLLFLVGTSGVVYPAAGLPIYAKEKGAKVIEINKEPSELSYICDRQILGKSAEILPELLESL